MAGSLSLPADPSAPRRARAFLAGELSESLDEDHLETAKLLVSELVTNSVVHAACGALLECDSTPTAVTVWVRDADTGPLALGTTASSDLPEGGRGLLLVEKLAGAWGTEHGGGRKTVWFRLPKAAPAAPAHAPPLSSRRVDADAVGAPMVLRSTERRLRSLTLPEAMRRTLTLEQQLRELVERTVVALGATGAEARTASGDLIARLGEAGGAPTHTAPLALDGRALGTLTVHLRSPDEDDLAFLRIAAERLSLLCYEHDLVQAQDAHSAGLTYLADATDLLAGTSNSRSALALLTQLTVPRLGDWAAAYTVTERHAARRVTASHRAEERLDPLLQLLDGDVDLDAAIQEAATTGTATRVPLTLNVAGQRTLVVILPLTCRGRPVGVLVLGRAQHLDAVTFAHMLEFARRAAVAVDNARMHEEHSQTANALQSALLPAALPTVDGLELAARYHTASPRLLVGGDFYDAFQLADGSVVCGIGDVCGKGAEAAAVTGMSRDLIRLLLRDGHSLVATLQRLNSALIEDAVSSRFCTVALTRLVQTGRELNVQVCLAGHPEPVLLRADGTTELVGAHGDLLGVLPGAIQLTEVTTTLGPQDSLVLYTDGITERRDGTKMFGQDGLRRALQRLAGGNAVTLAEGVQVAAQSFVEAEIRDDLALLVARRTALHPPRDRDQKPASGHGSPE